MNCRESQNLFSAYLEEELSVLEEKELREHLAICDNCAGDYRDFEATVNCLRQMPKEVAGPEMTSVILSRVRRYQPRRFWPSLDLGIRRLAPLAAMLVVGFLSIYGLYAVRGGGSLTESANSVSREEVVQETAQDGAIDPAELDSIPTSILDEFETWGTAPGWRVRGGEENASIVF